MSDRVLSAKDGRLDKKKNILALWDLYSPENAWDLL